MSIRLSPTGAKRKGLMGFNQVGGRKIAGLLFVLVMMLPGCGLHPAGQLPLSPQGPAKAMVTGVPFFPQDELQCGPAALAMALHWSGIVAQPSDLTPEVFTPGLKGSLQSALVGAARRHARVAYPISGRESLLAELAAGHPVIVLVNLGFSWYPKWHYAVAIGYDQELREVILHSGLNAGERLNYRVFTNIWRRSDYWGLLVLPPERLPAGADGDEWMTAVAGLEQAGQWQAAASGYAAALQRWEKSFPAWMGLGNSRYRLHDLAGSAAAFQQAALLSPENGMAYNNLAHVLAEQGRQQEALAAAQQAVVLGGPFIDTFRETLDEIRSKSP